MRRSVATALTATALGALPVFMLGGLAVQVREELGFGDAQLGAAVAVFFAVAAVGSTPAGRVLQRVGAYRGMAATALLSAVSLLGIGLVAVSYRQLLVFLVVGGAANAIAQPAANLLLASRVPLGRQGLLFGVKQAAVPVTTLLAGAAVPTVGLTVGWRWAFVLVAAGSVLLWACAPRDHGQGTTRGRPGPATLADKPALLVMTAAGVLAASAVNSLGVFLVASAVANGLAPGTAGVLLAIGSALGIATRILAGWRADFRDGDHQRVVAWLLVAGAAGFVLLALGAVQLLFLLGTVLAFGPGWGWNGLFTFAVVRRYPTTPAAATGITQTGLWIGGMVGPLAFGFVADRASYPAAWLGGAACLVLAAACVAASRWLYEGGRLPSRAAR